MKLLAFLYCLFLTSCAGQFYLIGGFETEVEVFQTEYTKRGNDRVTDLIVKFDHIEGDKIIGLCLRGAGTPRISIRETFWKTATRLQREALILHEMGHCILDRDHSNTTRNGYPMSVMQSSLVQEVDYKRFRKYYINELFSGI